MNIKIGYNSETGSTYCGVPKHKIDETEQLDLEYLIKQLGVDNLEIKKKAADYTTLTYKGQDIARYKHTDNVRWIEIAMCYIDTDREKWFDSELFEAQNKMNVAMWKSKVKFMNSYIELLKQIIKKIDDMNT